MLVVEFRETKIDVAQGNIDLDSTHKQIVDIMEGGKEAFDKRTAYLYFLVLNFRHSWQRCGNKKSDSVCFTDNSNNIDTL